MVRTSFLKVYRMCITPFFVVFLFPSMTEKASSISQQQQQRFLSLYSFVWGVGSVTPPPWPCDSVSNFSGSGLWAGRLAGWADRCCCCCCPIYTDGCVCNILQIRTGDNGDCLSPRLYIITSSGLQDIDERDTHTHPCMEWMDSVYSLHASLCVDSIFNRTTDEAYNS